MKELRLVGMMVHLGIKVTHASTVLIQGRAIPVENWEALSREIIRAVAATDLTKVAREKVAREIAKMEREVVGLVIVVSNENISRLRNTLLS